MDIAALSTLGNLAQTNAAFTQNTVAGGGTDGTSMFSDLYDNLIDQVNSTDSALQGDIVKAAEGELDNPQQLMIDSSKATIALQMITSVRNDALSAYNDIIKMQI